ncbi:MAG TPA: sugar ABC transporter substrate-binding protein [Coriobacteriia bacterium]|nr:sugar ABC transporter substrate-binding protein [Coriobacteriia bacterium]
MDADFTKRSCEEFVEVLASAAPVPGGGGGSALVGALGMALGNMVGSLTVGKPKFADVEADIIELKAQSDALQRRLIDLVAEDAKSFEPLSKAYGLPKETEAEKAHKAEVMESCLREACGVPLAIMQACCEAIDIHEQFADKGTPIAISDVGVGVKLCQAALQGASLNVFINTQSMTDRAYAAQTDAEANGMLEVYVAKAETIFANVAQRFK